MDIKQGDIYWVTIDQRETKGSEQYGPRPAIVISRLAVNRSLNTVVVVPMTTKNVMSQPAFRIVIPVTEITKDVSYTQPLVLSAAKTDQTRAVDKSRLGQKMGTLSQTAILSVLIGLSYICDIR